MKTLPKLLAFALIGTLSFAACSGDDKDDSKDSSKTSKDSKADSSDVDSTLADTLEMDTATIEEDSVVVPKEVLGQEDKAQAASAKKKMYNLSEHSNGLYNISMELPVGSKFEWDSDFEEIKITFGSDFVILVSEAFESVSEIKSKMGNSLHNQHLGYIKDEPNGFIRKFKASGIETHGVYYGINDGDTDILITSSPSRAYSSSEIMEVWKACKTSVKN